MQVWPAIWILLLAISAPREIPSTETGYRNCDTRHLSLCEDSNELFWGPLNAHVRKRDFTRKLERFLRGTPNIRIGRLAFATAATVEEALIGPGERAHLPKGEWFFSGFTPHDAPDQAAVLFGPHGKVLLIATLLGSGNGKFPLVIYAHEAASRTDLVSYLQQWGRKHVSGTSPYPGLPKEVYAGTTLLVTMDNSHVWQSKPVHQ